MTPSSGPLVAGYPVVTRFARVTLPGLGERLDGGSDEEVAAQLHLRAAKWHVRRMRAAARANYELREKHVCNPIEARNDLKT